MKRQSHVLYSCQVVFGCGHNRGSGHHDTRTRAAVVKVETHSLGDEKKEPFSLYTNVTSSLYINQSAGSPHCPNVPDFEIHCQEPGGRQEGEPNGEEMRNSGDSQTSEDCQLVASSKKSHTQAETFCLKEASSPRDRQNTADSLAVQNDTNETIAFEEGARVDPKTHQLTPRTDAGEFLFLLIKRLNIYWKKNSWLVVKT